MQWEYRIYNLLLILRDRNFKSIFFLYVRCSVSVKKSLYVRNETSLLLKIYTCFSKCK